MIIIMILILSKILQMETVWEMRRSVGDSDLLKQEK